MKKLQLRQGIDQDSVDQKDSIESGQIYLRVAELVLKNARQPLRAV